MVKILVKNTSLKETYENYIDFTQPIVLPPQISELESKSKQVWSVLVEKLEFYFIGCFLNKDNEVIGKM